MDIKLLKWIIPIALCLCGCKHTPQKEAAESQPQPTASEMNQKLIEEADELFDKELLEKMRKSDTAPPRVRSHVEVLDNKGISAVDAERSWMFRQAAMERCFSYALAVDENQKGSVTLAMERNAGESEVKLRELSSEIPIEGFESCIRKAQKRWRLPEGASITIKIIFSTLPPLTAEDLDALVPDHRKHDDEHPHKELPNEN